MAFPPETARSGAVRFRPGFGQILGRKPEPAQWDEAHAGRVGGPGILDRGWRACDALRYDRPQRGRKRRRIQPDETNHAALSRRSRRQLFAHACDPRGAGQAREGPDQRRRPEEGRGPGDSEGHQEAGGGRAAMRDRRRIPPHVLAFRFLRWSRWRGDLRARPRHPVPGRADQAEEHPRQGQDRFHQSPDAGAFQVRQGEHQGDAEDVHPVADGDALPARARRGGQEILCRPRCHLRTSPRPTARR